MKTRYKVLIGFGVFYTVKAILYLTLGAALVNWWVSQ